jgi:hypothetical protein
VTTRTTWTYARSTAWLRRTARRFGRWLTTRPEPVPLREHLFWTILIAVAAALCTLIMGFYAST